MSILKSDAALLKIPGSSGGGCSIVFNSGGVPVHSIPATRADAR